MDIPIWLLIAITAQMALPTSVSSGHHFHNFPSKPNEFSNNENPMCGYAPNKTRFRRIIGGDNSLQDQWPWQVSIVNENELLPKKKHFCGGTLINSRWILTAAHCMKSEDEHTIKVHLGSIYLEKPTLVLRVVKIVTHSGYDDETLDNDIALLKLSKWIHPNKHINFACLPKPGEVLYAHTKCKILGWGNTRYRGNRVPSILQQATVPVVSKRICSALNPDTVLTKNMICAGFTNRTIDTCRGDSGGPLICQKNSMWTVYGVTSFGDGCYARKQLGFYTKVSNYVHWINNVVGELK